jgi:hypothetical protein
LCFSKIGERQRNEEYWMQASGTNFRMNQMWNAKMNK